MNILKPAGPAGAAATTGHPASPALAVPTPEPFPWDFLLLGVGAVCALVGLVTFGAPSALALLVALAARLFSKQKQVGVVFLLGVLVCLAGAAGGAVASYYVWVAAATP